MLWVGLVLDNRATNGDNQDADHVEVEPVRESGGVSGLELIGECELVGEAASIEADSTDKHVSATEGSHVDEDVSEYEEGEDGGNDCASDIRAPEKSLTLSEVENSLIKHESNKETAPSSEQSSTDTLQLHHEEAGNATDKDRANEHGPANPNFGGILEESCVEEEKDGEDDENGSDKEDCSREELFTEEGKENAGNDEKSAPDVAVILKESP